VFRHLAKTFQRKFGLSDKAVAFWVIHDVADEDHSGIGKRLLDSFAKTEADRRKVLEIVRETLDMLFTMYDGIHREVEAAGKKKTPLPEGRGVRAAV
jgi:pyrroloquinoline quinone (PQQ) biosynthesis protein C